MDSPDRDHILPPPPPQIGDESPAFQNYLSNLSPITSVKNVRVGVGHGFSELNFPPPPPVFTSPRIGIRKELRPQYPNPCSAIALDGSGNPVSGVKIVVAEVPSFGMIPYAQKESDCKEEVHSQSSSPSRFVDDYLADDPVEEECPNAVDDSSDLCSSQAATKDPQPLEGDSRTSSEDAIAKIDDVTKATTVTEKAVTTPIFSEQLVNSEYVVPAEQEALGGTSSFLHCVKPGETEEDLRNANTTEKKSGDSSPDEEQLEVLVSENASDLAELVPPLESTISGTQQDGYVVDQTTVAFASLTSKVQQQHGIGDWKKEEPICSSSLYSHGIHGVKLLHCGEACHQDEWDCTLQVLPQSVDNVQANDNPNDEKLGMTSNATAELQEPSLNQRGMRRRCLQFEAAEARRKSIGSHCSSCSPASIVPEERPPATPMLSETSNSSCIAELNTDFSNKHTVNFSKQASSRLSICPYKTPDPNTDMVDRSFHDSSNSPVTVSLPSGIGLHLNSLGNAVAMSCATNMQPSERDYLNVQGEKSLSEVTKYYLEGSRSCSVSVGLVVNVSVQSPSNLASPLDLSVVESTEIDQQENEAPGMGYSSDSFHAVPLNVKPMNSSLQSNLTKRYLRPCEKKRPVSQDVHGFGEFNRTSPKKKRRKPPDATVNEGCKCCHCKKSKCLKLYCECFAAGVYCVEPCTCQECFNKPEHEGTVLATRQQIESRNPLAFAPRIVRRVTESPPNSGEDVNQTPASARHKRGCNCKKSKCLKKYCECYQAGVGCSDGCRCEGCKNIFGEKGGSQEFVEMEYTEANDEGWNDPSEEKLDMVEIRSDNLHPEQCHSDLSPVTPIFRCSSLGREIPTSQQHASGHLRDPDSDISNVSVSYEKPPRSPGNFSSNNWLAKGSEGNLGLVTRDKGQNYLKAEKVGRFSPKWDGLEDIYSLTPMPDSPSRPAAAPASDTRNFTKYSRPQLCHGSGRLSSGSVRWRSSPVTPIPHIGARLMLEPDSDSGVHNILDDDTPEILKDTNSPIKIIKVRSPNQKRVSPPHNCLQELRRSNSSPGLRSGRKFILQSVPSFPPLSPDSEAKGNQK